MVGGKELLGEDVVNLGASDDVLGGGVDADVVDSTAAAGTNACDVGGVGVG